MLLHVGVVMFAYAKCEVNKISYVFIQGWKDETILIFKEVGE